MRSQLRAILPIVFLFQVYVSFGQVMDDFSDGDFSNDPIWFGDTDEFIVNPGLQLQMMADVASDTSYLSLQTSFNTSEQISWEFWLSMDFDPSNSNNVRVYLMSDQSNLEGSLNGYYIRIGESGAEDPIKLYKQEGANAELILTGAGNIFPISPQARIQVIRENDGTWSISSDAFGGTDFVAEGSVADDEFTDASYFGVSCKYTSGNFDAFRFDDFVLNGNEIVDEQAPQLVSIEVLSDVELDLHFSEPLDEITSENNQNYSSSDQGNPLSAVLDDVDLSLVHLEFANSFPANITQTLTINGVEDLSGNSLINEEGEFTYVESSEAGFKDVVFNEIFPDPTPSFGLPEFEWLEIHNPGNEFYDLNGWEFFNSSTSHVIGNYLIPPGGYVILCDDAAEASLQAFGDVIAFGSFSALTNTSDSLTLVNAESEIIDIVVYTDDWYQDPEKEEGGWTLELINPTLPCSGAENWRASEHPSGGTPGTENSIMDLSPDINSPELISAEAIAVNQIQLHFSESIDEASLPGSNLIVEDGPAVLGLSIGTEPSNVIAELDADLEIGVFYNLVLSGFSDCSGNTQAETELEFVIGFEPEPGEIIINEIMADPTPSVALPEAEYLEILNVSDRLIDLKNSNISGATFPASSILEPGEYKVILSIASQQEYLFYDDAFAMEFWSTTFLTNAGRDLVLRNGDDAIIDSLRYDISWYRDNSKNDGGWSLERINPEDPCSDADNWRASVADLGGSPGDPNSVEDFSADFQAPEFLLVFVINESTIQLEFSEPIDESSAINADYTLSESLEIEGISLLQNPGRIVEISLSSPMEIGAIYTIQVEGITDCWGNEIDPQNEEKFALPEFGQAGDLIINEILSNPRENGVDFIEIYNRSQKNISLSNWQIGSEENGEIDNNELISDRPFMLFPGEYYALTEDAEAVSSEYPLAPFDRILEIEDLPAYSNDEGIVVLATPLLEYSDRVEYSSDWHFGILDNTDGVSLERIDFNRNSQDPTNWHSAAESQNFATPGYLNSQSFISLIPDNAITREPEVFSPDNDGYQDVVNINYDLKEPGWVGNITIYDDRGREVRKLVQNELLGASGTFSWDGIRDDRQKAGIGIYIILFEIFTLDGSVDAEKLTCVLGHQLD